MLTGHEIFISEYEELFIHLYRGGNATHPRLDNIRPNKDAIIHYKNGVKYILADGNGISVTSKKPIGKKNIWKIPKGTSLPPGIKLVIDKRPNYESHYMLAPATTMKLSEFHLLMDKLRECSTKIS